MNPSHAAQSAEPTREFLPTDAPGVRRRAYETYDQYLDHQREKLARLRDRIEPSDAEYEQILIPRLGGIPVVASARGRLVTCLCLGARLGGEVRAFKHHGVLAIGVDLAPGEGNPHVLPGDFHALEFPDGVFEVVFTNALDHAWDLPRVAAEAWRVMRPGGSLILEIGIDRIGRYESLTADSVDAVLEALAPWFTVDRRTPIRNTTSYVDWEGDQVVLRRAAQPGLQAASRTA